MHYLVFNRKETLDDTTNSLLFLIVNLLQKISHTDVNVIFDIANRLNFTYKFSPDVKEISVWCYEPFTYYAKDGAMTEWGGNDAEIVEIRWCKKILEDHPNIEKIYLYSCSKINRNFDSIQTFYFDTALIDMVYKCHFKPNPVPRKKVFDSINLNGFSRPHRTFFAPFHKRKNNYTTYGHKTINLYDLTAVEEFYHTSHYWREYKELISKKPKFASSYFENLNLGAQNNEALNKTEYCHFSFVSETRFLDVYPNISEKTFLPIYAKIPFMLLAPIHSLELVKSLGFEVDFDHVPLYDNLLNSDRMDTIISFNKEADFAEIYHANHERCEHNFEHLKSAKWLLQMAEIASLKNNIIANFEEFIHFRKC